MDIPGRVLAVVRGLDSGAVADEIAAREEPRCGLRLERVVIDLITKMSE